jgi:hypothetical protein
MSRTNRSGEAVAAQHRKSGPMKHRNQPRGGARNEFLEYLEEAEEFDVPPYYEGPCEEL